MLSKYLFFLLLVFAKPLSIFGQSYTFTTLVDLSSLPVISQDKTGTCWSYSTSSFLESEIIRMKGKKIDLSEMFQVRHTYVDKAENYIYRQGKAQFSEGGLAHDVFNSIQKYGLVPISSYSGLSTGVSIHQHTEMVAILEAMLKTYVENPAKSLSDKWRPAVNSVLDVYLGKAPETFTYEGSIYTPISFLTMTGIRASDYITLTSFTHQPFYTSFILNIPDNFSNGSMWNLPLTDWIQCIDVALDKGFTLVLDCDVSESGFSAKHGLAVVAAKDEDAQNILKEIKPEREVTDVLRQKGFESLTTTDDHLMHIVGKVKDQQGNIYYKVKNSWGKDASKVAFEGYVYMSIPYIKLKGISISLHKDGLSDKIQKSLSLK